MKEKDAQPATRLHAGNHSQGSLTMAVGVATVSLDALKIGCRCCFIYGRGRKMIAMENPVLNDITKYAVNRLQATYGYCGAATGDNVAILNSSDGKGNDIVIRIESKKEEG